MKGESMKYGMNEQRWHVIKAYLNEVWKDPGKHPDKGLLISLSDGDATKIFTKARLQIINTMAQRKVKSMSELANILGRMLSAVKRDLELLEEFHIVQLERKGKNVMPTLTKEILIVPLVDLSPRKLAEISAIS